MSWAASLRSKSMEALISSMISAGPAANRPPHIVLLIEIVALDGSRMTKTGNPPRRRLLAAAALGALAAVAAAAVLYGTRSRAARSAERLSGRLEGAGGEARAARAGRGRRARRSPPSRVGACRSPSNAPDGGEDDARRFPRPGGAAQPLGDLVRALPGRNAGARPACRPRPADTDFEVVAVNVDTARLERRGAFLDGIGVKALARYADPSGDAFETLRQDGKALGLPVTMLIDRDGCEIGAVAGARQVGFGRRRWR